MYLGYDEPALYGFGLHAQDFTIHSDSFGDICLDYICTTKSKRCRNMSWPIEQQERRAVKRLENVTLLEKVVVKDNPNAVMSRE